MGFDRHTTSEHLLSSVIEELCKAGNSVHIIQQGTGGEHSVIPKQLSMYPVTTDVIPYQAADKGNFIARYLTELKYINACKKVIVSDYDAVFIQSTFVAGFAVRAVRSRLPKAIVTLNVQDIFPYNAVFSGSIRNNGSIFKMLSALQRYGYKHSDHIITISEDMKETLATDGTPTEKIEVVYNWSYQDEIYKNLDLAPVAHMFDDNYFNVVYAGNIGVMQNVDILVEAAKLMKDEQSVWFHIIGNGIYKEKLKAKSEEYGITNITFLPMQPPEMAPLIYNAADINVIPLVKDVYRTALPSKTATCLACGKPIIFAIGKESKFGQKIMKEAGCHVVAADRPEELVEAILKVKHGEKSNKAGEFFLKYCSITKNSKEYAEIITH